LGRSPKIYWVIYHWSFTGNSKYIIGILSSSPVDWHPFCANRIIWGGCVHAHKSDLAQEPRAHGCVPRGVWSQRSAESLRACRIVPAEDAYWNAEGRKAIAICGFLRLLVYAWQVMYIRASAPQYFPYNSAVSQSLLVVSQQMDAESK